MSSAGPNRTDGVLIDTVVFDVDGVLIDTSASFDNAVIATVRRFIGTYQGTTDAPLLFGEGDMAAFRRAGGFNDDWDLAYALIALLRTREMSADPQWKYTSLEEVARLSQGAGLSFIHRIVPSDALPDYKEVRAVGEQLYWGPEGPELTSSPHLNAENTTGFCKEEQPLVTPKLFEELRRLGVSTFGIFTGRNRIETKHALRVLGYELNSPFEVSLTSEEFLKPDPAALVHIARVLGTVRGIYVGDTRDDLQLVHAYAGLEPKYPAEFISVMIADGSDADFYRSEGADLVLPSVEELPSALKRNHLGLRRM